MATKDRTQALPRDTPPPFDIHEGFEQHKRSQSLKGLASFCGGAAEWMELR